MAEITTICTQQTLHSAHTWTNAFGSHACPGIELGDLQWDTPQLLDTGTIFASVPAPEWKDCCANVQDGYGHHPGCPNGQAAPQTVENLSNELCVGAEPDQPTVTQDELLTALDELLDSALHDDRCYIHENDTECVCVIGKVRAALPPCGAVQAPPSGEGYVYKCHRNAHPASPDRHVF